MSGDELLADQRKGPRRIRFDNQDGIFFPYTDEYTPAEAPPGTVRVAFARPESEDTGPGLGKPPR